MVKAAQVTDLKVVANLAVLLWPDHTVADLEQEFSELINSEDAKFFLKFEGDNPIGFAQCQLRRDHVEGASTTPVGYLEGIFVKEGYRNKGYAKELLAECEAWAKRKGCHEFASDCELDNIRSLRFHQSMNFIEANRIICFIKEL